ncbi:hypothetical protein JS562_53485, partial [Agrobacterium sp. S2]|nr:hypothetical protein [Agrobacterium sp. S2]
IAFDRVARSFESSTPQGDNLVVGEIKDTIGDYLGIEAALVHADIGTGHEDLDALTLTWLPDAVASLLKRGGIAACGLPLEHPELTPMPLPQSVARETAIFLLSPSLATLKLCSFAALSSLNHCYPAF